MATHDILIDRNNNNNNCDLINNNNNTTTVFIEKDNECNNTSDRNGTLIGTLLSSPSLKIHVNQSISSDHSISNISIVNCSDSENICVPTKSDSIEEIIDIDLGKQEQHQSTNLISTECQTNIIENNELKLVANHVNSVPSGNSNVESRSRRGGERRERRRERQSRCLHHNHNYHTGLVTTASLPTTANSPNNFIATNTANCRSLDILPTILPPPYTTLPGRGTSTTPFVPSLLTTVGPVVDDLHYSFPIPMIRRSPSERSGKGCCFRWFSGSPFRVILCVLALGGITCAIGGICIGTTTIIGSSASHLTTSLIMIGFGIIILTLSGLAWKFSVSTTNFCWNDFDTCSRRSYNRTQRGIYYPEFQHRPPPPSYQASMQEYRLRLLLLDRERPINIIRVPSPPPTYRSHNSNTLARSILNQNDINRPPSYNTTNINSISRSTTTTTTATHHQNHQSENVPEQIGQHDHVEQEKIIHDISKSDCKIKLENNEKCLSNTNNNELVTIVTISGYTDNGQAPNEMEVLAHL